MTETLSAETLLSAHLITELRAQIDGDVSTRSRVIDGLLDLRNAVRGNDAALALVDQLLADLPGLTTVPNGWWRDALGAVEAQLHV
jgi:hypothetical protein